MTLFHSATQSFPRGFGLTFGAIAASIAFVMELTLLPLLLSGIQRDLGLSVSELAWVFNAYAIAVAIAVLSSGFIGDIVDKQRLFTVGVTLFALGSVFSAVSSDLQGLILSRTVQGLGGGLFSPLVPILLTQANSKRSGKILMIWGGSVGVAAAVLPIAGNAIIAGFGWRAIFLVIATASLVAPLFLWVGNTENGSDPKRVIPDYRLLFSNRRYWLLLAYIFMSYGSFTFFLFYFPIVWHTNGFSTQLVSVFLTCVWLSFSLLSFLLRGRMEGSGLNRSLLLAPMFLASSFATGMIFQNDIQAQVLSAVLAGAGLACSNSQSTHLLLRLSPKELRAFWSSLDITFARIGGVVTVSLFSAANPSTAALAVTGLSLSAILCCWLVIRNERPAGM